MEEALGAGYAHYWADSFVMSELGGLTASQALAMGMDTAEVWRAVFVTLELPGQFR